ncbi:gliding motility protein GldL, partial [Polaribacter sp.]|uniref:type IX secretion system motor protein PorL/GldL n=1 Tax=Polaribacter sp. TaxID=1920175 RepID=UPI003F6CB0A2
MNFIYGIGAAVVIIGALFKIQHIEIFGITGGMMLTVGLIAEAIVFFISAFDTPEEDLDWSKVYPELADAGLSSEKETKKLGADGMLSQKLDNL